MKIYTHMSHWFYPSFQSFPAPYPHLPGAPKAQKRDEGWEIASEDSENPWSPWARRDDLRMTYDRPTKEVPPVVPPKSGRGEELVLWFDIHHISCLTLAMP